MITNMCRRVGPALVVLGLGVAVAACGKHEKTEEAPQGHTGAAQGQQGAAQGHKEGTQGHGAQIGGGPAVQGGREGLVKAEKLIAEARCAQMERCGHVGAHQKYVNPQVCMAQIQESVRSELKNDACKPGVLEQSLKQCEQELRAAKCDTDLGDIKACQTKALCGSD